MKALRIAYISESSPSDKHAWSGTVHYVYEALKKKGYQVTALGPARPRIERWVLALINKASLLLFDRRIDYRHTALYSKAFARVFEKKLNTTTFDVIIHCGTTETGAYLKTSLPVIYVLDRTIAGAIDYHSILSKLWKYSENQSIALDKKAMTEAHFVLFSSLWAAQHAQQYYRLPPQKIAVLPFGANLDEIPERSTVLINKPKDSIRLFLMGTYWDNKGAGIAVNAMKELRAAGYKVHLTVAGCEPPDGLQDPDLEIIPFIDKNSREGLLLIRELFLSHHFFILPTRFDCTPIVFCEASAFGVPVLSADTGGVAGHVQSGVNGYLLPYSDQGPAYANKILEILATPGRYEALCKTTRDHYEQALNWGVWSDRFAELLTKLI